MMEYNLENLTPEQLWALDCSPDDIPGLSPELLALKFGYVTRVEEGIVKAFSPSGHRLDIFDGTRSIGLQSLLAATIEEREACAARWAKLTVDSKEEAGNLLRLAKMGAIAADDRLVVVASADASAEVGGDVQKHNLPEHRAFPAPPHVKPILSEVPSLSPMPRAA